MARLRRRVATGVVVLALGGLSSCSAAVSEKDAYSIGCPAIDSALATGSVGNKAAVAGLKQLRKSESLSDDARKWADSAITLLESSDPQDVPAEARALIVDGCANNGFPLRNLK